MKKWNTLFGILGLGIIVIEITTMAVTSNTVAQNLVWEPQVTLSNKYVNVGDTLTAEIKLIAVNKTEPVEYVSKDDWGQTEPIYQKNGTGEIIIAPTSPGAYEVKGEAKSVLLDGGKASFSAFYMVGSPAAIIHRSDQNILYSGENNFLEIAVTGIPNEMLLINVVGAPSLVLTEKGYRLSVPPSEKEVTVSVKNSNTGMEYLTKTYKVVTRK